MKKSLLILCLVIASNLSGFAQRTEKVDIKDSSKSPDKADGRSVTILPQVWIDYSSNELTVSFGSSDSGYDIAVYDASGDSLCQYALLTDGVAHTYQLPNFEFGRYTIVIESDKRTFEGEIII